jgi:hypothetical protein
MRGRRQPQSTRQSLGLGLRQFAQMRQNRPQQPMQPGERQIRLGFHAAGAQDPHPRRRLLYRVLQQRRLADPGLAAHHQSLADTAAGILKHAVDYRALTLTAQQLRSPLLKPEAGHSAC